MSVEIIANGRAETERGLVPTRRPEASELAGPAGTGLAVAPIGSPRSVSALAGADLSPHPQNPHVLDPESGSAPANTDASAERRTRQAVRHGLKRRVPPAGLQPDGRSEAKCAPGIASTATVSGLALSAGDASGANGVGNRTRHVHPTQGAPALTTGPATVGCGESFDDAHVISAVTRGASLTLPESTQV